MGMNYDEFLNWCEDKWTREYKMQRIVSKLYKDDIDFLREQLKANVIALLTDIQTEIEELKLDYPVGECTHPLLKIKTTEYQTKTAVEIKHDCAEIIQQKLNALKEEDN
jgi:hypothetical protein